MTDYYSEDERSAVIKELTDPEEVDAAIELMKEKINVPEQDTALEEAEPEETSLEEETDTPGESTEQTETEGSNGEQGTKGGEEKPAETPNDKDDKFFLTDEVINKQPEDSREILSKYKGKGKEELAKAAANAIALKNPYLKDNQPAIDAIAAKLQSGSDEEIVRTLIDTQKEVGKSEVRKDNKTALEESKLSGKIELPLIPENDANIQSALNQETAKRLQKKYPTMPGDMSSVEYKEWERDLIDEEGLVKANQFIRDLETARTSVKTEMQKVLYAANNLKNLYNESPSEILPFLTDANLPRLKQVNDDFINLNNKVLEEEVGLIKNELQKYGISEADLGLDLSLTKDASGSFYNKYLNSLMFTGESLDPNIIRLIGKVPLMQKGQLAKKLIYENNVQILNQLVNKQSKQAKTKIERLKEENLNTLGGTKSTGTKKLLTTESIDKETDPEKLDKYLEDIKAKL